MKIKLITILLLIAPLGTLHSMSKLDSLNELINKGPQERKSYYMAEYVVNSPDPGNNGKIAFESLSLALKSNNNENIALANFAVGRYYLMKFYYDMKIGDFDDSAKYYMSKSIKSANYLTNKKYLASLYSSYAYLVDNNTSIFYYDEAQYLYSELKLYDKADDIFYRKIHIYISQKDFQEADSITKIVINNKAKSGTTIVLNTIFKIEAYYHELGLYEQSVKLLKDFRKLINNQTDEGVTWKYYYLLGTCEWYSGNSFEALKYCDSSLIHAQKNNRSHDLALSYELYGIIYTNKQNMNDAESYYRQALVYANKMSNDTIISRIWMNIATMYMDSDLYEKALNILIKYQSIFKKSYQDSRHDYYLGYLFNLSECYFYLSDEAKSKEIINEMTENFVDTYSLDINTIYHLALGRYFYLVKNYKNSAQYLKKALSYAKILNNYVYIKKILDYLPDVMNQLGNLNEAYEYMTLWSEAKDSVNAKRNEREMIIYEAKKENEIKNQKIKLDSEIKNQRQNLIINIMIIAAVILIIFAAIVFKQRMNSEKLLLNILPKQIARRLKKKEKYIAERFNGASVIFIDIANFTKLSSGIQPERLVEILNDIFTIFDNLTEKYGLEKIKTIGDCYLAASGIPVPRMDHAIAAANMAIETMKITKEYKTYDGLNITFRIGIDCGPIVAGIIGKKKFIYDLWGDTVNTASRMEDYGVIGEIQVSGRFKNEIDMMSSQFNNNFTFVDRGIIEMKGKGQMHTWLLRESE